MRAILLLLSLALPALATAAPVPERPNILLLVAEDMSSRVGAFGDPIAVTPQLDALAAQGVRYPNTFTTAGVCAPSRAALITGLHAISIGAQHMRTSRRSASSYKAVPPPGVKAFPELLRAAGYYTFTSAKLDYQFSGVLTGSGPFTIWDAEDDARLWQGRADAQPFFGMLNFGETHESGVFLPFGHRPHSFVHLVMQLARAWIYDCAAFEGSVGPGDVSLPPYYADTPTMRADLARHYDNVACMDARVGEVLDRLQQDGLADSTIVVWTTDHGDGLPRAKRELLDSGIRVPMIIRWPEALRPAGALPGGLDERLISFVDLAPTLLELAGVERPEHLHGRSFVSATGEERQYVRASRDRIDDTPDRQRAIRDDRFKYIRSWHPELPGGHPSAFRDNQEGIRELRRLFETGSLGDAQQRWFEPAGAEQLFDTRADPDELRDLSRDPTHTADLARMRAALDAWLSEIEDWSEDPEDAMVARFQPEGRQPITPTPEISLDDREAKRVSISTSSPGASIGYRIDGGPWLLYSRPFEVPGGSTVIARAVRYGWRESDPVALRIE